MARRLRKRATAPQTSAGICFACSEHYCNRTHLSQLFACYRRSTLWAGCTEERHARPAPTVLPLPAPLEPARRMGVPDRAAAAGSRGYRRMLLDLARTRDVPLREDPAAEQRRADVQPVQAVRCAEPAAGRPALQARVDRGHAARMADGHAAVRSERAFISIERA